MLDAFTRKKRSILEKLTAPDDEYTDRSAKGAIDEPIRDLINEINAYDGLVTTSSCSGRISVYLEGAEQPPPPPPPHPRVQGKEDNNHDKNDKDADANANANASATAAFTTATPPSEETEKKNRKRGKWLFMSHAPLHVPLASSSSSSSSSSLIPNSSSLSSSSYFHDLFGVSVARLGSRDEPELSPRSTRFVHFKFEPMILHILTASKEHAHVVLAAAQSSGFRESGATSLPRSNQPHLQSVMVAVRSTGLLLDSIIGFCQENAEDIGTETTPGISSIVNEAHLRTLVKLSNDRFVENEKRIDRFRKALGKGNQDNRMERSNKDKDRNRKGKKSMKTAEEMNVEEEIRKERSYKSQHKDEVESDNIEGFGWILEGEENVATRAPLGSENHMRNLLKQ